MARVVHLVLLALEVLYDRERDVRLVHMLPLLPRFRTPKLSIMLVWCLP